MITNFLRNLGNNVTLLTANRRLAAFLRNQYDAAQLSAGKAAWASLDVLPLISWIERCLQIHPPAHQLILTSTQELMLWKKIIAESALPNLINIAAAAQTAQQAWRLLIQWDISLATLKNFAYTEDAQIFWQWAQRFSEITTKQHWIDEYQTINYFIEIILAKKIKLPAHIILAGFQENPPQLQRLFAALATQCTLNHYQPDTLSQSVQRISLRDTDTEIKTMASWAKHTVTVEPTATIACIVPQLTQLRTKIERIFNEVFTPENVLPGHSVKPSAFNIAGGEFLSSYPCIYIALQIIQLARPQLSLNIFQQILSSPFLTGAEQEFSLRVQLAIRLREQGERNTTLRTVLATARTAQNENNSLKLTLLITAIENFLMVIKTINIKKPPSAWTHFFSAQLTAMGWPGERGLNSTEYQLVQRWQLVLNEFSALDFLLADISYEAALTQLTTLLNSTLFQAKTPEAPIQILGELEAIDLPFDYVWVMGLDSENWPGPAKPNPFIPLILQKRKQLPGCCATRELMYCQLLTANYLKNAKHLFFSHATANNDKSLKPSALITEFNPINLTDLTIDIPTTYAEHIFQSAQTETLIDQQAPAIINPHLVTGGSKIFRLQAACPFRAFAEIRLKATPLPSLQSGLSPQERGTLLHEILARIWRHLNNQHELQRLTTDELQAIITRAIDDTLITTISKRPLSLKTTFTTLERKRLTLLMQRWLAIEKNRPFFHVVSNEEKINVNVGSLRLTLQIDRIDELATGALVIIDYKTSMTNISVWFGERLEDPQLPLYCLSYHKAIDGILFAQIRANDMGYKGIVKHELGIEGTKTLDKVNSLATHENFNWENLKEHWQQQLAQLGQNFLNGHAEVNPKDKQTTCQYCHLTSLCRINSQNL